MKKILQASIALFITLAGAESKAQLLNGSIAADWTLTDINNVSHNLYSYLDAGKTVYIDVSATWCGPCWTYKQSGAFEQLWAAHGPSGGTNVSPSTTNDVMLFFFEGDGNTTNAQLNGIGSTQGNWVAGVSFPIIDPPTAQINPFKTDYKITYFPTIYMICPDRSITEIGQPTATAAYAKRSTCSFATVASDAEAMVSDFLNPALASCDSVTPTFRIGNVGTSNLTSATITYQVDAVAQKTFQWTGNLATYANTIVTGVQVSAATAGTHTITAVISNPNGVVDPTAANNSAKASFIKYAPTGGPYVIQSFESSGIPATWGIANEGHPTIWANATTGLNSAKSAVLRWCYTNDGGVDMMVLDAMSFASATTAQLSFDMAHCLQYSVGNGKLEVEVSTNCGTTWTPVYNKAGAALATAALLVTPFTPASAADWRNETVDLSAYAGQANVLVRFKATAYYGNNLYIDNVNVTTATGMHETQSLTNVSIYPNPVTSDFLNFSISSPKEMNAKFEITDVMGRKVLEQLYGKMNAGTTNHMLSLQNIPAGLYSLSILTNGDHIFKNFVIER